MICMCVCLGGAGEGSLCWQPGSLTATTATKNSTNDSKKMGFADPETQMSIPKKKKKNSQIGKGKRGGRKALLVVVHPPFPFSPPRKRVTFGLPSSFFFLFFSLVCCVAHLRIVRWHLASYKMNGWGSCLRITENFYQLLHPSPNLFFFKKTKKIQKNTKKNKYKYKKSNEIILSVGAVQGYNPLFPSLFFHTDRASLFPPPLPNQPHMYINIGPEIPLD